MFSSLPLNVVLLSSVLSSAFAAPQPNEAPAGLSMSLRRNPRRRSAEEWGRWAKRHRDMLTVKYGGSVPQKRSSGTNLIVNQEADSSYYGSLAIGTPAVSYDVLLDTGSSDLWIAGNNCFSGCDGVDMFDTASSSTFTNKSTSFSISYGSGGASGSLGSDVVQMAGFSVSNQIFGVCDDVSTGLLTSPVSGLMGLAWQALSSSGAVPFWQALVSGGAWDTPVMSFQLTRYVNDANAQNLEPGGTFTMGFVNSTLYTGDIDYVKMPSGTNTYWMLPLETITVQGSSVSLGGSATNAAIDTGTTLVGGPASEIAEIYAQIEGSSPGTGDFEGYYLYPCDTSVNVSLNFGGRTWSINPADFQAQQATRSDCVGAFFTLTTGNSAPSWIVGDTFLKNVYSVFRYDNSSIGFAELSAYALSLNDETNAPLPSATIGSVAASVSATGTTRTEGNSAVPSFQLLRGTAVYSGVMAMLIVGLLI